MGARFDRLREQMWSPRQALALMLTCTLTFGSYFAYDMMGGMKLRVIDGLGISKTEFGLLYSVYSVPNWIMVFLSGVYIDTVGVRIASVLMSSLITSGAALVAFAGQISSYALMLVARFFFGIGAEAVVIAQNSFIVAWFPNNTAFTLALSVAIARFGTVLSFQLAPKLARKFNDFRPVLWIAAMVCGAALVNNILMSILDKLSISKGIGTGPVTPPEIGFGQAWNMRWNLRKKDPSKPRVNWDMMFQDVIRVKGVREFPRAYWLIVVICIVFYSSILGMTSVIGGHFQHDWHYSEDDAGRITSYVMLTSMIMSPFLGAMVDRVGQRPIMLMIGTIILIPAQLMLGLSRANPTGMMIGAGVAFSLVPSALWPSIPQLVPQSEIGSAFGMCGSLQNVGLALSTLFVGVADDAAGITGVVTMLLILDVLALLAAILLYFEDRRTGGRLKMNSKQFQEFTAAQEDKSAFKPLVDDDSML